MEVNCLVCGTTVERSKSRLKRNNGAVYCSQECWKQDTKKEERICKTCSSIFLEYPSRIKDNRGHYCSKECADKGKEDINRDINKKDRDSTEQKKWKLSVLQRDSFKCVSCNTKKSPFNVHHILGFSEYPELRNDINNGITLCECCHKDFHSLYGQTGFNEEDLIEYIS